MMTSMFAGGIGIPLRFGRLAWQWIDIRNSLVPEGPRAEHIDLPVPVCAAFPADSVEIDGRHIGVSQRMSFLSNAGVILSQAIVDIEHAKPGTEAVLLWGKPDSCRRTVESREVRGMRVVVAPVPHCKKPITEE